ncbi:hypothetical protein FOXB_11335 [Fusarium oxysporum f. sp. conglutinans Fo5176]|uniref:Uncharacterized protein n=1 Tax=Fusarium oxysporum (strain Fo5176) TaxID=660025 RepID=F9FY53_FUSOF|nr:hypothetical protein FOXB_11335 [Fusarium oxysporum f. sp. conglutinans Fo5176]
MLLSHLQVTNALQIQPYHQLSLSQDLTILHPAPRNGLLMRSMESSAWEDSHNNNEAEELEGFSRQLVLQVAGCDDVLGPWLLTMNINGIQIDTEIVPKEVNICDAVRDALGSDDFVNNTETYCTCLSNAVYWGSSSNAKPSFDNRASVVKNQLAATNGWTFVRAPEIDVATYKRLSKAVISCYTGTCDEPKVRAFFASYVENADSVIDSDFVRMLNKWVALFESLKKRTTDIQTYSKLVQARLKTVSSKVNSVKANVCKNNACKGSTPANAFKKFATVKSLQGVPIAAGKALANIPKMTQITLNAIKDVIKAFRVTQYLPQAAEDLKKLTGTFNLISNHAGASKTAATSINQILSVKWSRNSELSKTSSGCKVRDGLISIQRSFRNDLKGPLDNLIKANKAVEHILIQLPLRKKRLEFSSGGVSYSRWTNARMPVPCKRTQSFIRLGDFRGVIPTSKSRLANLYLLCHSPTTG